MINAAEAREQAQVRKQFLLSTAIKEAEEGVQKQISWGAFEYTYEGRFADDITAHFRGLGYKAYRKGNSLAVVITW